MSSLYVHIPYCKQACSYCNFYFSTVRKTQGSFVEALLAELALRKSFFAEGNQLQTIYMGGGTPSLLNAEEVRRIFGAIHLNYSVVGGAEITLEANPDDINTLALRTWQEAGINRLSVGVQSFAEEDLRLMNRAHTAQQAEASVKLAQDAGFDNLTLDIIYHLPGSSLERWTENVDRALALGTPHVSCYGLTVEPKTLLAMQVAKGDVLVPTDAAYEEQYLALLERTEVAGYNHYEVASFAKPGMESRHNSAYWSRAAYLGLGPGAHSFDGRSTRSWNLPDLHGYIEALQQLNPPPSGHEHLSPVQVWNECLLTGLRTAKGFNASETMQRFGLATEQATWLDLTQAVLSYIFEQELGAWDVTKGTLRLNAMGLLQVDHLTALLMLDEEDALPYDGHHQH